MRRDDSNSASGFSLIELLIVVTVMLIIAAIAIPKMLALRQEATAAAAVGNLKTINNGLEAYAAQYPSVGYPATLTELASPAAGTGASTTAAALIDDALAASATVAKQGYLFTYTPATGSPSSSFTVTGAPTDPNGYRYYYMTQDGVIRYNDGGPAGATSQIIG